MSVTLLLPHPEFETKPGESQAERLSRVGAQIDAAVDWVRSNLNLGQEQVRVSDEVLPDGYQIVVENEGEQFRKLMNDLLESGNPHKLEVRQ